MAEEGVDFKQNDDGIWKKKIMFSWIIQSRVQGWPALIVSFDETIEMRVHTSNDQIFVCMKLCNVWELFLHLNNSLSGVSYDTALRGDSHLLFNELQKSPHSYFMSHCTLAFENVLKNILVLLYFIAMLKA